MEGFWDGEIIVDSPVGPMPSQGAFEGDAGAQGQRWRCCAASLGDRGGSHQPSPSRGGCRKLEIQGEATHSLPKESHSADIWISGLGSPGLREDLRCSAKFTVIYYNSNAKLIQNTWKHLSRYWRPPGRLLWWEEMEPESGIQSLSQFGN